MCKKSIFLISLVLILGLARSTLAFRFTVAVDNRGPGPLYRHVLHEITANVGDEGVFHISPGDIDPPSGVLDDLVNEFGSDVKWYPGVGNHEVDNPPSNPDIAWIRDYYDSLYYIVNGGPAGCETTTYSFDFGIAHFVQINEYYDGVTDAVGDPYFGRICPELYNWLEADLDNNTKPVVFVFGHQPYNSLWTDPCHPEYTPDHFWELLQDKGVTAYICGHSHQYNAYQPKDGVVWQVDAGTAGATSHADEHQTFIDITVSDNVEVQFDVWQGLEGVSFLMTHSWTEQLCVARNPSPAVGAEDVSRDAGLVLSWIPGHYVADVNGHKLYFSTDKQAVINRTVAPVITTEPNYTLPEALALGETYYWRVDEVNDPCTWPGYVWKFTATGYLVPPVDDFESYTDDPNLRETWNEIGAGHVYLHPEGYESDQSMNIDYNNVSSPYYSEAGREFYTAQDWTTEGVKVLTLWFRGEAANDAEQMYVALEDADGNDAMVPYDGDVNDVKNEEWQQWNIALSDFTDVNIASIKKVFIGFGDRDSPMQNPVSGDVYFDDIKLYVTRCIPEFAGADVDGDCVVDFEDLDIMAHDWLAGDFIQTDFNGILTGYAGDDSQWVEGAPGLTGNALVFDGNDDCVVVPGGVPEISTQVTVAFWAYGNHPNTPPDKSNNVFHGATDSGFVCKMRAFLPHPAGGYAWVYWDAGHGPDEQIFVYATPSQYTGQWNHYAFTKNTDTDPNGMMSIYLNGSVWKARPEKFIPMDNTTYFTIGAHVLGGLNYPGLIDDFRIYDRELTATEIADLHNLGPEPDPGPIRWYKFDESSGLIAEDSASSSVYYPLVSPANLYDAEPIYSKKVNLKDYTVLADAWLEEQLWPLSP